MGSQILDQGKSSNRLVAYCQRLGRRGNAATPFRRTAAASQGVVSAGACAPGPSGRFTPGDFRGKVQARRLSGRQRGHCSHRPEGASGNAVQADARAFEA
jgi:hypothetical protein